MRASPLESRPEKHPHELSDDELEVELTVAASAPDRRRFDWFQELLRERLRRLAAAAQ
jgi:hypothetical protein